MLEDYTSAPQTHRLQCPQRHGQTARAPAGYAAFPL